MEVAGRSEGAARDDSPLIEWVVDQPGLRLGLGDSVNYTGDADLVFSHLYGPLPKQLIGKPAIINLFGNKKAKGEEWCGSSLTEVSKWSDGTNTVYAVNTSCMATLTDLSADEFEPGHGWFPEELVRRLLVPRGIDISDFTVFDGFMGRGTVGKIARERSMKFVGIDLNPARVAIAREYLGC